MKIDCEFYGKRMEIFMGKIPQTFQFTIVILLSFSALFDGDSQDSQTYKLVEKVGYIWLT